MSWTIAPIVAPLNWSFVQINGFAKGRFSRARGRENRVMLCARSLASALSGSQRRSDYKFAEKSYLAES